MLVVGDGAGAGGTGPVVGALDHGIEIGFLVLPMGGEGEGGGAVLAEGYVVEELHCHTVGVEEEEGDLVVATSWDGLAVPVEGEGGALGGEDEVVEWFYVALAEDESGIVVMEVLGLAFYEGVVVGAGGDVHLGHVGGEVPEGQVNDGTDEAHHLHDEGETGAVFELPLGATVAIVGGHGADAELSVADVAYDGAAVAGVGA